MLSGKDIMCWVSSLCPSKSTTYSSFLFEVCIDINVLTVQVFFLSDFIILLTFPPFIPLAQDVKLCYWTVFVGSPVATCLSQYLYDQLSSNYFMSSASAVSLGTLTAEDVIVWDVLNLRSWRVTLRKVSKRRDEERSNWWLPFGNQ